VRKGWKHPKAETETQAAHVEDLVERQFTASGPDRLWRTNALRIATDCGVIWGAAIRAPTGSPDGPPAPAAAPS
jgi:hypothetical protein